MKKNDYDDLPEEVRKLIDKLQEDDNVGDIDVIRINNNKNKNNKAEEFNDKLYDMLDNTDSKDIEEALIKSMHDCHREDTDGEVFNQLIHSFSELIKVSGRDPQFSLSIIATKEGELCIGGCKIPDTTELISLLKKLTIYIEKNKHRIKEAD